MRNFTPQTQQFSERPITRDRRSFGGGAFDDISPSKIPSNGVKWLENLLAYEDRQETRGGSKRWGGDTAVTYQIPRFLTGLSITKSGSTISSAAAFVGVTAGMFVHYDDGGYDLIISVTSTSACIVDSATAHAASTAAWINEPVFGLAYHTGKNVLVLQCGSKLYVANRDLASGGEFSLSAGWNRIYGLSTNLKNGGSDEDLAHEMSDFAEYGDFMVVFNLGPSPTYDYSGIYAIRLGTTPIVFYPINASVPSQRLTNNSLRSETNKHGYRYLYTHSRIRMPSGSQWTGDRTTVGAVIELESGPTAVDASTNLDYGEEWRSAKIGPSATADNYDVWTGGTLPTAFDTLAEVSALNNAQFKITCGGSTYNIVCNFTGVSSWAEIADVIQTAVRGFLPDMEVSFNSSNKFVFKNKFKGGDITSFSSGDSGTNIYGMFYRIDTSPVEGSAVSTVWDTPLALNTTSYKLKTVFEHWTHYSIYRTLDIGEDGVDPITGQGNNKELYVWVADIPIIKAFGCDTNSTTKVLSLVAGSPSVFTPDDVGKQIVFQNNSTAIIESYASASLVMLDSVASFSGVSALIGASGSYKNDLATKSGTTVTCSNLNFNNGCTVGDAIFWEDGSVDIYVAWLTDTTFQVSSSGTKTSQAIARDPAQCNFYDRISDDTLRTRINGFALKNRFWVNLPNANTGIISDGFLICGERGKKDVSYCQMASDREYLWGYYNAAHQYTSYRDTLTRIAFCNDNAVVFLQNSIHRIPLNNYSEITLEEVGEIVVVLTGTAPVSPETGCKDFGAVLPINNYSIIFISSENELLLLEYYDAPKLSADMAKDRFRKRLRKNIGIAALYYDKTLGLLLWIKTASWETRTYSSSGLASEIMDKSYRVGMSPDQGIGVSENTGGDWVMPFTGAGGVKIKDSNNRPRPLVLDLDGYLYDLTHREGATSGTVGLRWKDKILADGTGGTNIAPSVLFGLDEGTFKHFYQEFLKAHAHVEPFDRANANASGYDSEGYPDNIEFDLTVYADGNTTTVKGRAKDIVKSGQITLDRSFRAHGIQCKFSANKAEFIMTDFQVYYKSDESEEPPSDLQTTEMTHKADLASVDTHFAPINGNILNLVTGKAPTTVPTAALVAGPCGQTCGITIGANTIEDTNKALSYTGDFSVLLGVGNVDSTGTFFYIGTGFSIRVYLDGATYKVAVLHNSTTYTHSLSWDGAGWVNLLVVRSGSNLIIYEGTD